MHFDILPGNCKKHENSNKNDQIENPDSEYRYRLNKRCGRATVSNGESRIQTVKLIIKSTGGLL
ncbi:UNKNOWN [Stylonychia lemnae]|uniref:Uncharacterized protein n=1 Tax=Stylonychia lemnae TaxID=5949 RepID=A0A078ADF3_STYLE|nr:UNKNOWN [Stylonychia lemnae]|eukprot:CDW79567.1 UNKNOWN [Stylonychia lemnae]